jgi:hypothetical protein
LANLGLGLCWTRFSFLHEEHIMTQLTRAAVLPPVAADPESQCPRALTALADHAMSNRPNAGTKAPCVTFE